MNILQSSNLHTFNFSQTYFFTFWLLDLKNEKKIFFFTKVGKIILG